MCMRCHGPHGEGVAGEYDEALAGEKTRDELTKLIAKTMPEDAPGTCTGPDADAVAGYVYEKFYSPEARARLQPAKVEFSRLTVRQYRNAVADLVASFAAPAPGGPVQPGGLKGEYFASKDPRGDKRVLERVDAVVDFTFENATPDPKLIPGDEFAARWSGAVIAEETGEYEFVVRSENGVRLWVNNGGGRGREGGPGGAGNDGRRRGDAEPPIIDEWVSSGSEPREHRKKVFLLGGRAYPIRLATFRYKDKTASVALNWTPPHGATRTIPARNLSPAEVPPTLVVTTPFPPDDGSMGYERGTSVSKEWAAAATGAALEAAGKIVSRADDLAGTKPDAPDRTEKLKAFCAEFAQRAFRRPLSDAERAFFRDKPFEGAKDAETAVKRAVLVALTSPRFLYPELPTAVTAAQPGGYDVAARLALALWDSLPDRALLDAAAAGKLATPDGVAEQARRMLDDPRARAKVRDFLHNWLQTEEAADLSKDPSRYPDFNAEVLADLRTSLDLFLDAVVWDDPASDYRQLLLADHLYLNDRLAKFLGAPGIPEGGGFQKVAFDPNQRSGVLTHPFLLSALAYHNNSSPIHRGVFLTRNVVGRTLRPPPAAVEFKDDSFDPGLTMREKVTQLTRSDNCMGCHAVINPLGFSLENFDAVGRFRTTDNDKPIDAASEYAAPDGTVVKFAGPRDVAQHAAASPEAHRAFIRQLFHHAAKQPAEAYGPDVMENLRNSFVEKNFNVRALLIEIAKVASLRGVKPPGAG
ncbi:MAG: hypothetical protein AVDCRST_MAG64-443 [uncultured Phycisphaerae bacterium]|uniref:PA14 domain-containing protein n=1 Tax=uncultured Phycisphaerae bacterium TaxID=904963 RepID=A0A6J4N511_9BACT|nr:MAG: hypothetical protein AVDCRST_MAG64-443 [uncultured Phycisphaerae bacterium]